MEPVEGSRTFQVAGDAYDAFMGRYSRRLAGPFLAHVGVTGTASTVSAAGRALDVGCGPGALTTALVEVLGAARVAACDPSPPFLEACAARHPGIDARAGAAESLPYGDAAFDVVLAQLILHFVSDPDLAVREMCRVAIPGGVVGACQWSSGGGMELIRRFWDAATVLDPDAPAETHLRFGEAGELGDLFTRLGLLEVEEAEVTVRERYRDVDELWSTYLLGVGPAGAYCTSRTPEQRAAIRAELIRGLGDPSGPVELTGVARVVSGTTPS